MALSVFRLSLIWAIGCCWNVAAQYGFSIPYPDVDDFDPVNTIVQGTVFNFIWIVNDTYQPTVDGEHLFDDNSHISLWLTSFDGDSYTQCLAASVYSGHGGSWAYAVDLSDDDIDAHGGKFVYRLKPTVSSQDAPYDDTEDEVPSRGFLIEKASDAAAASSSSAAAAASSSSASVAAIAAASRSAAAAASQSEAAAASQSEAAAQSASQAAANSAAAQASSASESAALATSASAAAEASKSAAEASSASLAAQTTAPPDQSSAVPTSAHATNTLSITSAGSPKTSKAATGTAAQATSTGTGAPTISSSSSGGLSAGAKAGIAIGAIALALLAAIALILFLRHRKRAAAAAELAGPPQPVPIMAQDKHFAEHNRNSAPQFMGQPSAQPGYAIPSPPPQVYRGGGPVGETAELGGHGGYGAQELPNPHGYGYGAELPAYERPG